LVPLLVTVAVPLGTPASTDCACAPGCKANMAATASAAGRKPATAGVAATRRDLDRTLDILLLLPPHQMILACAGAAP
jgi:hypothetical protein